MQMVPYPGSLIIEDPDSAKTSVGIPDDSFGKQIYIILEVKDNNRTASLFGYRRIVLNVSDHVETR